MNEICDLYFSEEMNSPELKYLKLYDASFAYAENGIYSQYLNVNINRIKLIPLVIRLRKNNPKCFSVPIEYRDNKNFTKDMAFEIAKDYAAQNEFGISFNLGMAENTFAPLFWAFSITSDPDRAGGFVRVDRLDGHIWKGAEIDKYMYDYNNVI